MQNPHPVRRTTGSILLAAGLIILLGVAGYFGWTQIQAAELRAQLQKPPASVVAVIPTEPIDTATLRPTFTARPPTQTVPAPTHTPAPAIATEQPAATTATPTQVPPTPPPPPLPSATPAPAAVAPARLVVPDLKIDTNVIPMGWEVVQTANGPRSEWVIPKNEAGHHIDSALLGQPGNLVLSGHNNIYGKVFQAISFAWDNDQRIQVDDFTDRSEILNGRQVQLFDAAGNMYTYVVTEFYRLKDTGVSVQQRIANARFMQPTDDTRLTVITCWPPTNNTHRLIVIAKPVE